MGLASAKSEGPAVTTREEAYAVAKEAFNKVGDLPRDLECGATLTRCGGAPVHVFSARCTQPHVPYVSKTSASLVTQP